MRTYDYADDPESVEAEQIRRQMALAQMIAQQGASQTPVYSNKAGIAKMLQAALGGYEMKQAEKKQMALAERRAASDKAEMGSILSGVEQGGQQLPPLVRMLAGSSNPQYRQMALAMALKSKEQAPEEFGTTPVEIEGEGGKPTLALVGKRGTMKPMPFVPARKPEKEPESVRAVKALMAANGIAPESPQGKAILQQALAKATSHQPGTSVTVSTEKGYSGAIASGLAQQDLTAIEAGRNAPGRIDNARRIKEVLEKNPITGTAANWRLAANKALSTAGVIDGTTVKNTEDLAGLLASATLDAIKTSGLGSGQGFTDKDRQFLEKARAGNIEINAGTLRMLADLNERAGVASVERANKAIRKLKGNPNMGGVGMDLDEITLPGTSEIDDLVKKYGG